MKAIFDRHAESLTPAERALAWKHISTRLQAASAPMLRHAAAGAMVAAALVAVAWLMPWSHRKPAPATAPGATGGLASRAEDLPRSIAQPPGPVAPAARPAPQASRMPHAVERHGDVVSSGAAGVAAALPSNPASLPTELVPQPAAVTPASGTGEVTGRVVDARTGAPVAFANVVLVGSHLGAQTDADGRYRISHVPPGRYQVQASLIGYAPVVADSVRVGDGPLALGDLRVQDKVVKQVEEIQVGAERRLVETRSSATVQGMAVQPPRSIPVDNLQRPLTGQSGAAKSNEPLHFRGGRSGEVKYQFDGISAAPPVVPTTGGSRLPNDEAFDSMFFRDYGVNPFVATDEDALSTFALDVDTGSYTLTRRYLELGQLPPPEAVRAEEFINYFPDADTPFRSPDFHIRMDGAPAPFAPGHHLLRIRLQARDVDASARRPARLTFVVDVSGSMAREDRLGLVKRVLSLLVNQLRDDDAVGLVVFGTTGRVVRELEPLGAREGQVRRELAAAIDALRPEGSTNTEDGLRLAYDMARRAYASRNLNRIVLCSDGVANEGATGPESILARVRHEADGGIALTTVGFGMGNYNDVLMEQLADKGDGNHYYVDDFDEARRVFVDRLAGTLELVAKDAKVQVEFDSTRVARWRLIGFENRDVADRDFRNDRVDAGEVGAGHAVTALYDVKLVPRAAAGTLATVRLRYQLPEFASAGARSVREIEQRLDLGALEGRFEDAPAGLRFQAAVAEFAEVLRQSYWAREVKLADVQAVALDAASQLHGTSAGEFVRLVERAAPLLAARKPADAPTRR
jgi:Ca-activated chloride channel family protein